MEYINEHTWIGQIGHFFILLAFVAALFAAFSFFIAEKKKDLLFKKVARVSFLVHAGAVFGTVFLFAYMISNHYFEFNYVWKYSSLDMKWKYIFSCFWAGQEGSFLTWIFWQVVVGLILMFTSKKWESSVMVVFASIQALLMTMIFGVYIGDFHLGTNPFTLIRELPEYMGLPWTQIEDYLAKIPQFQDGQGLNPLLQNYWMTIHPPTTFLGFALSSVPFCFAIAALWRNKLVKWAKPALPWSFLGVIVLGVAIIMGGAWAYESLSFGGFWAWDPVENAILIPWLTFVGAAHILLVIKNRKRSIYTGLFLSLITFILIIYSTFLTRSGVLGDSSVHSFTGEGMLGQLLFFLVFVIFLAVFFLIQSKKLRLQFGLFSLLLFVLNFFLEDTKIITISSFVVAIGYMVYDYLKNFPREKTEDSLWSREFWMFIGALLLTIQSIHLTKDTSIPVINLIFDTNWDPFTEIAERYDNYNPIHAAYAFFIMLALSFSQFLKYKKSDKKQLTKIILVPLSIAVIITGIIGYGLHYQMNELLYLGLVFASVFAFLINLKYISKVLGGKVKKAGSNIAHIGLALVMIGAVIATSKQQEISVNTSGTNIKALSDDFDNNENIQIFKGDTLLMGDYFVSYREKELEGIHLNFDIDYYKAIPIEYAKGDRVKYNSRVYEANVTHVSNPFFVNDESKWNLVEDVVSLDVVPAWKNGIVGDSLFTLHPFIQLNEKFGYVSEPGTKHFLDRDVFTFLKYFDQGVIREGGDDDGFMHTNSFEIGVYDTLTVSHFLMITDGLSQLDSSERLNYNLNSSDLAFKLNLRIADLRANHSEVVQANPPLVYIDSVSFSEKQINVQPFNINIAIDELDTRKISNRITLKMQEPEYIVMEAIVFPYIGILWLGTLIMTIGTFIAIVERIRTNRKK